MSCKERSFFRILISIAALLSMCWAAPAFAACKGLSTNLALPAPAKSQVALLYGVVAEAWNSRFSALMKIEPHPGRGGSYAWSRMLDVPRNGCELAALQLPSFFWLNMTKDRMYEESDLTVLSIFASVPNAIWVAENSPYYTLADLMNHARKVNATPGAFFAVAGVGSYTDQHLATLEMDRAAGVKSLYVPVLGSAEAIETVKNGGAVACWGYAMPPETMPGMRALGITAEERSPLMPHVATFAEARLDVFNRAWFGLAMPVPAPLELTGDPASSADVALLEAAAAARKLRVDMAVEIYNLMNDTALQQRLTALGFRLEPTPPDELAVFMDGKRSDARNSQSEYRLIPVINLHQ